MSARGSIGKVGNARSGSEEQYHAVCCAPSVSVSLAGIAVCIHQRVRKANFGSVDGAIAGGLCDSEDVVVLGVEDDALGGGLRREQSTIGFHACFGCCERTLRPSRALDMVPRQLGWTGWRGSNGEDSVRCARDDVDGCFTSLEGRVGIGRRLSACLVAQGETEVRGERGEELTTEPISHVPCARTQVRNDGSCRLIESDLGSPRTWLPP